MSVIAFQTKLGQAIHNNRIKDVKMCLAEGANPFYVDRVCLKLDICIKIKWLYLHIRAVQVKSGTFHGLTMRHTYLIE